MVPGHQKPQFLQVRSGNTEILILIPSVKLILRSERRLNLKISTKTRKLLG